MNIPSLTYSKLNMEKRQIQTLPLDYSLLATVCVLICLGLVMVGSSSVSISEQHYANPFHYLWRQLAYLMVGIIAAVITLKIPVRIWQELGPGLIMISMLLLVLVFVPGLGRTVNGSTRWLNMVGFNLQPSELVKLFTLIYLAGYLVRHQEVVKSTAGGFFRPLLLISILVSLLLLEPDYGAAAVLLMSVMGLMWLAGVRFLQFFLLLGVAASVLALLAYISPYRMERLTAFINPWADPFDSGFQLTQALIAFGRGDWLGAGLGESVQKLFYLPEAHTDFVFAVMAEELGLLGVLVVIALYTFLIFRILFVARQAELRDRPFAAYLAYGIGLWIGLQVLINIGVNMGILPTKGLTLPFMSYGGSNLVVMMIAMAILFRIDYETHRDDRPGQKNRRHRI
ncbi:MAG: putative lipid II flippase FtsW [Gammaproteobacteria bacterium]|nr:putative lipid II flippase FtsW [Gammaproteobacteria bacterium]